MMVPDQMVSFLITWSDP